MKRLDQLNAFDFLKDSLNRREREIANHETEEFEVDTCAVSDGILPYETAIRHSEYNGGHFIVVEGYDTPEAARTGHEKWVKIMTENPPTYLVDVGNDALQAIFGNVFEIQTVFPRKMK